MFPGLRSQIPGLVIVEVVDVIDVVGVVDIVDLDIIGALDVVAGIVVTGIVVTGIGCDRGAVLATARLRRVVVEAILIASHPLRPG
jgi:hypothetical protein